MAEHRRILVLCTGNSCRSQMAEGFLNALYGEEVEAHSAGSRPDPRGVNPSAVAVMAELGIDISGRRSKSMMEFVKQPFDLVVTVCDSAREACPVYPGAKQTIHRSFDDPYGDDLVMYRRVRDEIRAWVESRFWA